jgi:hypothetical protein
MDSNTQIIKDLRNKVGFNQTIDLLNYHKGVPVIIHGKIHEIRQESILFKVEPPDSICLSWDDHTLILRDSFISGIQGQILEFDLQSGIAELGDFAYSDRGFGERAMVRVEPEEVIEASLISDEISIPCTIIDLSLNGFGIRTESKETTNLIRAQDITVKLSILDQKIEISGTLLAIFPKPDYFRLAVSFSQETPDYALITRYITQRRAEIRQEIKAAYQEAIEKNT